MKFLPKLASAELYYSAENFARHPSARMLGNILVIDISNSAFYLLPDTCTKKKRSVLSEWFFGLSLFDMVLWVCFSPIQHLIFFFSILYIGIISNFWVCIHRHFTYPDIRDKKDQNPQMRLSIKFLFCYSECA